LQEEVRKGGGQVPKSAVTPATHENLWDDEAIIRMLIALKNNPPSMLKRLEAVDSDRDGKLTP
jgi:hypothetical protein